MIDNPYFHLKSPHYTLKSSVVVPHPAMFSNMWKGLVIPTASPKNALYFSVTLDMSSDLGKDQATILKEADAFIIKELREKGWINEERRDPSEFVFSL